MGENADFNLVEKVDGERGGIYVVKINEDANTYIKFHMFANRCQFFKCDEGVVSLAIELNNFCNYCVRLKIIFLFICIKIGAIILVFTSNN